MSRSRLVFIAVLIASLASVALGRTWTDNQGNQIKAKFVRVYQGNVVLSTGGRVLKVPFANFSLDDQDYIREQLKAKGQEHLVPPASRIGGSLPGVEGAGLGEDVEGAEGGAGAGQPGSRVGEMRTWTDIRGRSIQAQFVGVLNANVVLLKDGRRVSYPFAFFSPLDRQYVRDQLEARGEGHLVPQFDPGAGMDGEPAHMPGAGPSSFPRPGGFRPPGRPPRHPMPSHEYEEMPDDESEYMADYEPEGEPDDESDGIPGYRPGNMPGYTPRSGRPGHGGPPGGYTPPGSMYGGPGDQYESEPEESHYRAPGRGSSLAFGGFTESDYYCGNCNEDVPAHLGAGDNCPHCGVYWDYEETADGRTLDASGREISPGVIGSVGGAVVFIVLAVLAVCTKLALYQWRAGRNW